MSGDVWLSPVESGGRLVVGLVLVCRASRSVGSATASDRTEMRRTEQGARIAEYESQSARWNRASPARISAGSGRSRPV